MQQVKTEETVLLIGNQIVLETNTDTPLRNTANENCQLMFVNLTPL